MNCYEIGRFKIHRFVYKYIDANMFVFIQGDEALLIDVHINPELDEFLEQNQIKKITILLTHEHYDHTCGITKLSKKFETTLVCHKKCSEYLSVKSNNRPILISYIIIENDRKNGTNVEKEFNDTHSVFECAGDILFDDQLEYTWKDYQIKFKSIPGHTPGSVCIEIDKKILFTGDSLLLNLATITRFPGGSTKDYNNISLPYLKALDRNLYVFPGHEDAFYLKEKFKE